LFTSAPPKVHKESILADEIEKHFKTLTGKKTLDGGSSTFLIPKSAKTTTRHVRSNYFNKTIQAALEDHSLPVSLIGGSKTDRNGSSRYVS